MSGRLLGQRVACDQVMEKVDYPKGLIRYTTERAIEDKETNQSAIRHILRPRVGLPLGGICAWPALLTVEGVPKVHGTTCLPSASLA